MMTSRQRFALGFLVVPSFLVLGFVSGATVAVLLETSTMGFDQLSNMMGGGMVGLVIGGIAAVLLLQRLSVRGLIGSAVVAIVLAALLLAVVRAGAEARRAARQAAQREVSGQLPRASAFRSSDLAASLS
jgi:hypothetical protein